MGSDRSLGILAAAPGVEGVVSPATATVWVSRPGDDRGALWGAVLGTALPYLLGVRGARLMHASCVVGTGGAVAFVGAPGVGKSSVAASLLATGWRALAGDALGLPATFTRRHRPPPQTQPGARRPHRAYGSRAPAGATGRLRTRPRPWRAGAGAPGGGGRRVTSSERLLALMARLEPPPGSLERELAGPVDWEDLAGLLRRHRLMA